MCDLSGLGFLLFDGKTDLAAEGAAHELAEGDVLPAGLFLGEAMHLGGQAERLDLTVLRERSVALHWCRYTVSYGVCQYGC